MDTEITKYGNNAEIFFKSATKILNVLEDLYGKETRLEANKMLMELWTDGEIKK